MSETLRSEKRDGRAARWTAEYARTVVEQWRASGQSAVAFAARHGIHASRLSYWAKHFEQTRDAAPAATFVAIPMEPAAAGGAIELEVDGVVVRLREGTDARYVAQLVKALGSTVRPC
jgi:transposase-like protein